MSRWVSLVVLLAIIGVTGVVMYRVMAAFLLPLFLASVLTVIFRPLHVWMERRFPRRDTVAALATTAVILLLVLAPLGTVATLAVREGFGAVSGDVMERADQQIARLRYRLDLEIPFRRFQSEEGPTGPLGLADVDLMLRNLPDRLPLEAAGSEPPLAPLDSDQLTAARLAVNRLAAELRVELELAHTREPDAADSVELRRARRLLTAHPTDPLEPLEDIDAVLSATLDYLTQGRAALRPEPREDWASAAADDDANAAAAETTGGSEGPAAAPTTMPPGAAKVGAAVAESDSRYTLSELRRGFGRIKATYEAFRIDLLGGPIRAWLTDFANPGATQLESLAANVQKYLRSWLPSVAGQATAIAGHLLLGLAIMSLAVFYFLKDGPAMIRTLMKLSPLDDRYEQQLLEEFDKVSRAVVLATLLSAVAQGLLGGIAYLLAGFQSVFLLTSLTIVLAMVPFVGAAAVWFPAALWLAFVDERLVAGGVLFLYGVLAISMVDNLIKPYVLHGQSKLHPLLALLSVLGGVQALGPIGILVGPMVVSFLQALLNILHHELQAFNT